MCRRPKTTTDLKAMEAMDEQVQVLSFGSTAWLKVPTAG
jgi:hypothetical protein